MNAWWVFGRRIGLGLGLMLLLAGCETAPVHEGGHSTPVHATKPATTIPSSDIANADEHDGPPAPWEIPADILAIPDAVPRDEPRSDSGNPDSYVALGQRYYVLRDTHGYREKGRASWYGKKFQGKRTSSGEPYDMFKMTAAHRTLPIPCYARITNVQTNDSVIVKINDRGPFHSARIIDVSYTAAAKLGMLTNGEIPVELEVVEPNGSPKPPLRPLPTADSNDSAPRQNPMTVASNNQLPKSVAPPPDRRANAACPAEVPKVRFLQTGVFRDSGNAATMRDQLSGMGFAPVQLRTGQRDGKNIYRVVLGPISNDTDVDLLRHRLADLQLTGIPLAE
jgi:rare lipoprotein A